MAALEDNRLYTPEEVCANGWLGSDTTPEALRKGTRRKVNPLPCTRFPPGAKRPRIFFSKKNVLAIQEAGLQDEATARPAPRPRQRRALATVSDLPPTSQRLTAKPEAARRTRRAS